MSWGEDLPQFRGPTRCAARPAEPRSSCNGRAVCARGGGCRPHQLLVVLFVSRAVSAEPCSLLVRPQVRSASPSGSGRAHRVLRHRQQGAGGRLSAKRAHSTTLLATAAGGRSPPRPAYTPRELPNSRATVRWCAARFTPRWRCLGGWLTARAQSSVKRALPP